MLATSSPVLSHLPNVRFRPQYPSVKRPHIRLSLHLQRVALQWAQRYCVKRLRKHIAPSLGCANLDDYVAWLEQNWVRYLDTVDALLALQTLKVSREASHDEIRFEYNQSTIHLRSDAEPLHPEARAVIEFATETYSAALDLAEEIVQSAAAPSDATRDAELAAKYNSATYFYMFGFFSLHMAARQRRKVAAPVMECIFQTLREAALDAYASAREAIELRKPEDDAADLADLQEAIRPEPVLEGQ